MKQLFLSIGLFSTVMINAQEGAVVPNPAYAPPPVIETTSKAVPAALVVPELKLTPMGVEPVVVNIDGKTASELYQKTLNWVQETWKNPESVLKTKIEGEKIRVEGITDSGWSLKTLGMKQWMGMRYTVEIGFKDGKYRFEYTVGEFSNQGSTVYYNYTSFFKKDGTVRSMYEQGVKDVDANMNSLNVSLYNYITGQGAEAKKKDW